MLLLAYIGVFSVHWLCPDPTASFYVYVILWWRSWSNWAEKAFASEGYQCYSETIVCTPPPLSGGGGGGGTPNQISKKGGGLAGPQKF